MTIQECNTLEDLKIMLGEYIEADRKWKADITLKITPLIEERYEKIILQNAAKYVWKGITVIVLFLGSVGIVAYYLLNILKLVRSE